MSNLYRFPHVVEELYDLAERASQDSRYRGYAGADQWPYEAIDETLACLERQSSLKGDIREQVYRENALRVFRYILPRHRRKQAGIEMRRTRGGVIPLDARPTDFTEPVDESLERRPEYCLSQANRIWIIQALRREGISEQDLRIFIWHEYDGNTWMEVTRALPWPGTLDALRHKGERLRNRWQPFLIAHFFPKEP